MSIYQYIALLVGTSISLIRIGTTVGTGGLVDGHGRATVIDGWVGGVSVNDESVNVFLLTFIQACGCVGCISVCFGSPGTTVWTVTCACSNSAMSVL